MADRTDVEAVAVDVTEAETYGDIVTILRRFEREVRADMLHDAADYVHAPENWALGHTLVGVKTLGEVATSLRAWAIAVRDNHPDNGGDDEQAQ